MTLRCLVQQVVNGDQTMLITLTADWLTRLISEAATQEGNLRNKTDHDYRTPKRINQKPNMREVFGNQKGVYLSGCGKFNTVNK